MKFMLILFLAIPLSLFSASRLNLFVTAACCPLEDCQQGSKEMTASQNELPIACNLSALSDEQRKRLKELSAQIHKARTGVEELPDGYAFKFPCDSRMIPIVAEYISLEHLCCPFFKFELLVDEGDSPVRLRMTGRDGVKAFMQTEFAVK